MGKINKKSGIFAVNLPSTGCGYYTACHRLEKETVYPECKNWISIDSRAKYERCYPEMPERIIDNLLKSEAKVSVTNWSRIESNPSILRFLIDAVFEDRAACEYDLSQAMRRNNS